MRSKHKIKSVMIVLKHFIFGGTEKNTLNLVNNLVNRGVEVTLVTGPGPLVAYVSPKVNVFIAPISQKPRLRQISEKIILEAAKTFRPQIIHTQCRTSMLCSQSARISLNIPLITHEHHMYDDTDYPLIVNELDTNADKIVTIGPYTSKKLIRYSLDKNKVSTILNGIDVNVPAITGSEREAARVLLKLKPSDKVVVCLSRVVKGKGIDKLIMGFAKVSKEIPDAKLIIAGDDDEGFSIEPLKKLISSLKVQSKVSLYPGEYNIRKFHAAADVFCYPAICKGMAVMEAMAAGLPIVGKKTVKKPLVVEDNISGLMTEPSGEFSIAPGEIAKKLIYLLKRPRIAKKMGKMGRIRIEQNYDLNKAVEKTLKLYQKVQSESSIKNKRISAHPQYVYE
jgi:glycosyltransferase involved in cell wall biosynthesis